jgi:hypothetical protein
MYINRKCGGFPPCQPWNKGKLSGQKPPLQPKHVWAIRASSSVINDQSCSTDPMSNFEPLGFSPTRMTLSLTKR